MRNILPGVLLLLFFMPGLAAAATINATSCSYNDVQAAINSAQSGDTILVPAGSCTWSSQLKIVKGIYLIGAGVGNTVITCDATVPSYEGFIYYKPSNPALDEPFRISGFEIDGGSRSNVIFIENTIVTPISKIRIDHNKLRRGSPSLVWFKGHIWGVGDNNIFSESTGFMHTMTGKWADSWTYQTFEFGSANQFYWEDNEITVAEFGAVVQGGQGGRYCYRYNAINMAYDFVPLFDAHGNQPGLIPATMGAEIYENTITVTNNRHGYILDHRGGMALVYNNIMTGGSTAPNNIFLMVREEYNDSISPPAESPDGETQHVCRSYYWNNTNNGTRYDAIITGTVNYGGDTGIVPQENRDFWQQKIPFDGSSGIGVGLLTFRPSSCTLEGAAWWATNESKLYRWHNGTWELYYTPYTYPHPLRTDCVNYPMLCDSGIATINADSCSYADVLTAVNAAQSGDTVQVPAGSCTWMNTLVITKGITLQGAGIDLTKIAGQVTLISIEPDANAASTHATFKIKGFTFDGQNATSPQLGYSGLVNAGTSATGYVNLIIIQNKFKDTTGTGIYVDGSVYGVASHNQFDSIAMVIRAMGEDYDSWNSQTQEYGTANNFHFEDNSIFFSPGWCGFDSGWPGWIETGQGGRIVVRYNTWDEANNQPGEYWDVHGLQNIGASGKCEGYSTMVAEYYGNNIIHATTGYRWMYDRGGWLMMYNNALDNPNSYGGGSGVTQYYCDSCQERGNFVQKATNTYFWNNRQNEDIQDAYVSDLGSGFGCPSDPIIENVDFFNHNASCTKDSCSAGVGCGSDTPTGACTPGVGYWKTSQSCSNLSGMVGANPATPITGTFYKCTAPNTWTAYYTPYTYPHPLASGSTPPQPVPGDINGDRLVDINDLVLMALHFGQTNMHASWNITVDVVANNEIDIYDIVFVSTRFT